MATPLVPVVAVGGVVVGPGPRILVVQRATPPLQGAWSLPGGKVRGGELLTRAVEREVLEETGLRVLAGDLVQVVEILRESYHYVIHDYLCTPVDPGATPRAGDDASAARWVRPSELAALGVRDEVVRVVLRAIGMREACLEDEE